MFQMKLTKRMQPQESRPSFGKGVMGGLVSQSMRQQDVGDTVSLLAADPHVQSRQERSPWGCFLSWGLLLFLGGCGSLSHTPAPVEVLLPGNPSSQKTEGDFIKQSSPWTPPLASAAPLESPKDRTHLETSQSSPEPLFFQEAKSPSSTEMREKEPEAGSVATESPSEAKLETRLETAEGKQVEAFKDSPSGPASETKPSIKPETETSPSEVSSAGSSVEAQPNSPESELLPTSPKETLPSHSAEKPVSSPQGNSGGKVVAESGTAAVQAPVLSGLSFLWPIQGRIQTPYGATADGLFNNGLNIRARKGTPIRSAESGVVTFVGENLKAYGTIVLVRHEHEWTSAYAHVQKSLVKKGDPIKRGQIIAYSGDSGQIPNPQLHFELRYKRRPVNPELYLSPQ